MLSFFRKGLKKTHEKLVGGINKVTSIFSGTVDEELLEELEQVLIETDLGVETALEIVDMIRDSSGKTDADQIYSMIEEEIKTVLGSGTEDSAISITKKPFVILVAGVNGTGKTTTIAKLAHSFKRDGKKVILAACDTFRAAAVAQLQHWAKKVDVDIVQHGQDADAASVAYDALEAACARNADVLIIDTAGRFHTRTNLLEELKKIRRTIAKKIPDAPHETLLVLDATTGQNALQQAETFQKEISISGLVLSKIDGTAKGGIVIAIKKKLGIPVKYVGLGEGLDDLQPFNTEEYISALLEH